MCEFWPNRTKLANANLNLLVENSWGQECKKKRTGVVRHWYCRAAFHHGVQLRNLSQVRSGAAGDCQEQLWPPAWPHCEVSQVLFIVCFSLWQELGNWKLIALCSLIELLISLLDSSCIYKSNWAYLFCSNAAQKLLKMFYHPWQVVTFRIIICWFCQGWFLLIAIILNNKISYLIDSLINLCNSPSLCLLQWDIWLQWSGYLNIR